MRSLRKPRMAAPNANMSGVGGSTPVRGKPLPPGFKPGPRMPIVPPRLPETSTSKGIMGPTALQLYADKMRGNAMPRPDIKSQIGSIAKSAMGMGSAKKFADGGLANIAENAESLMGKVDDMADTINFGTQTSSGGTEPLGFNSVSGFKKGGKVKMSSKSNRGDGIAKRGKTKGRMI